MSQIHRTLACILGLALTAPSASLLAADHQHADHKDHAPAKLQLDKGKKWPTDEALRKGMNSLRAGFAERIAAIHAGKLPASEYQALGARVDAEVANIVTQCKLEPKADAMLHLVVADLLAAAEVMQGKAQGKPEAGAHKAVTALNGYGRYFDHPQWKPLK